MNIRPALLVDIEPRMIDTTALQDLGLHDLAVSNWSIIAAVLLAVIVVTTRIQTATSNDSTNGEVCKPPRVPYWLPVIGHIPSMAYDGTAFLRRMRDSYREGAYSLTLGGTTHSIVYTPSLVSALVNCKDTKASNEKVSDSIGEKVFGFPMHKERDRYHAAMPAIRACWASLLNEEKLGIMVDRTARIVDRTICNLASFSRSLVDQQPWERTAQCTVAIDKQGREVVAANLLDLVRDYCAAASNESIIGSDFVKNYPDYLADLWSLDRAFILLGIGLPRWLPIPMLTRGHIARRNLMRGLSKFEVAMDKRAAGEDPGAEWANLDDVGAVIQDRIPVYRKHGLSMVARSAFEMGFVWATNANSNMLVFWMLNHIYADKDLLSSIRAETAPYILATQPKQELAIPEPPRLSKFDVDGVCTHCPLLKSCYVESLRVDSGSWSFKIVQEDFVLAGRDKQSKQFLLKKGEFIHAAHDVHNSDPAYYPEPSTWIADRHVKLDENGKRTADLGTIRPYGGGSSMCKGRFFAYKECMIFVAAIIAMWEIEPIVDGPWKMPKHRKATGVYGTADTTRVYLRRRDLPVEA